MRLKEFLRVAKSDIIFIVGVSSLAGFLANPHFASRPIAVVPLLITGFFASASAAIFNNLYDYDLDLKMSRTRYRGEIIKDNKKSLAAAAGLMLAFSVLLAYVEISPLSSAFIFLGFFCYTVLYTMVLKRRTSWSIVIGGSAASFALLAGWSTMGDGLNLVSIYLALIMFVWIPMHFWSFAVSHVKDYEEAKVPMLPAVIGNRGSSIAILVSAALLILLVAFSFGLKVISSLPAYLIPVAVVSAALAYFTYVTVRRPDNTEGFRNLYRYSHIYVSSILIAVIATNAAATL